MEQGKAKYLLDHLLDGIDHLLQVEGGLAIEEHTADSAQVLDARHAVQDGLNHLRYVHELLDGWAG